MRAKINLCWLLHCHHIEKHVYVYQVVLFGFASGFTSKLRYSGDVDYDHMGHTRHHQQTDCDHSEKKMEIKN